MLRKLIIIAGPTAVGKTTLSIQIAKEVKGEIISADSRQLYRHMDIATAKPGKAELAQVSHHGFDLKNPDERHSAGQFVRYARGLLEDLWGKGIVPVVVGGTGLYIQALLDGLWVEEYPVGPVRIWLQNRLQLEGLEKLYRELAHLDPIAHARIEAGDTQRVLRATELALTTNGKGGTGTDPLNCTPLAFCLSRGREELNRRIDRRAEEMLDQGLIEEVEKLLALGYNRGTCAMQSLGYQELLDHLEGKCTLGEALAQIKLRTRQYAKRQFTWFRKDRRYRWVDLGLWGLDGGAERVLSQFRNQNRF